MTKQPSNMPRYAFLLVVQAVILLALGIMTNKLTELTNLPAAWILPITIGLIICTVLLTMAIQKTEKGEPLSQGTISSRRVNKKNLAIAACVIGLVFYCVSVFQFNSGSAGITWNILGNLGAAVGYGVFSGYMVNRSLFYSDGQVSYFPSVFAGFLALVYGGLAVLHVIALLGALKNLVAG